MSQFWSDIVHQLTPYVPGEQPKTDKLIKLNTNENPYGPSPKVIEALKSVANADLRLYPDPNSEALKAVIAQTHHVTPAQVFVGNGSDEVLAHVFHALFKHKQPILFPEISYSFYPVYCGLYEIEYKKIPLADDFTIQIADYFQPNGGIIFPNPNAPTGVPLALAEIKKLLQRNTQSVVVVDEAYVDFGTETAVSLIHQYPNLLVTHTLSKSRSLAGLRVGYAIGSEVLIEALIRVKDSFNSYPIDRFASAGAIAALQDIDYFVLTNQKVIETRDSFIEALKPLGFTNLPSGANFVFVKHQDLSGELLSKRLREHNIIVRHFKSPNKIADYLRITIGTNQEMKALIEAIKQIL
jgi:histidinol-phosphate aminotransferase